MGNCCGGSAIAPADSPPGPVLALTKATSTSTAHPTSSSSSHVASSSGMPPHDTAQHYEMTALSPKRVDWSQETQPPFRARGMASPQLRKYPSMDTAFLQGRSHSPGRMSRASSANLPAHGPQPTGTPTKSGQTPADRQEHQPLFPFTLQRLLSNDFRFRILVVGKRGSGKSSLIKSVFNVDMSRAPTNDSGIPAEFCPRDNRRLIVHECSAFGPGELQAIRDFITIRNHKSRQASERLHAIWICVPMSDVARGQFDEGLKLLLDTGVPLVIAFTMFDQIVPKVSSHGIEYERANWEGHCRALSGNVRAEIVSTQLGFRNLVTRLVATTDGVIMGHSRNTSALSEAQRTQSRMSPMSLAWSVSQRASRSINIQAAIEVGRCQYWRRLGSSGEFAGQTLTSCFKVIRSDIVGVWNLPDKHKYLSSKAFEDGISQLIEDLSRPPIGSSSRPRQSDTEGSGAAWLNERYENKNEYICLVVAYIVDLTVILCKVFDRQGNVSPSDVQSIMREFASSGPKTNIHAEICRFLKAAYPCEYQEKNDVVLEKIIDLIRQNCDTSSVHI